MDHGGVIRRHELSDRERELLAPPISRVATTGRTRVADRQVINGMVYRIRTRISWRDPPERYGLRTTVHTGRSAATPSAALSLEPCSWRPRVGVHYIRRKEDSRWGLIQGRVARRPGCTQLRNG
ncbi:transposase [Streptomyces sp. NPDC004752]